MAYVEEHAQPGDSLLLANLQQEALFAYYGTEQMPPYWFANSWYPQFQTDLQTITEGHDRLWLVMFGNPAEYDPAFVLENWLSQNAFRAYHGDYVDAGLSLYVVSNTEPNQSIEANFQNLISLTAYGLSSQTVSPGDTLELALAWQTLADIPRDYTIFTHLIDEDLHIWAQVDNQPLGSTYPTSRWEPGEHVVDRFALQLDPATPPGEYWIQVGWYDSTTTERLSVLDSDGNGIAERVLVAPVHVEER